MSAARRRLEPELPYSPSAVKPEAPLPPSPETAPSLQSRRHTLEEYQQIERLSPIRHEYLDGEIRAMAGTMPEHNRLARDICFALEKRFEGKNYESFIGDIKVAVTVARYRYPDVIAVCGGSIFDSQRPPALLNPMVIVEVLSGSTEESERNSKFLDYREIASATDYVLISQERMLIIHFARKSATQWTVDEYSQPEQLLSLPALEVEISLAEIYRKVSFPAAQS